MKKLNLREVLFVGAGLLAGACSAPPQKGPEIQTGEPVVDAPGYVMELEQGWTDDTQQHFYDTPQGSEIMPYAWILALEQPDNQKLFTDKANIERYRYLVRTKSTGNPDALPVGWTKGKGTGGNEWFGFTCAACHTTELEYVIPETAQKMVMRVNGAPTLADFNLMNLELVEALRALGTDSAKFDRFAAIVLPDATASSKAALKGEIASQADTLDTRNKINYSGVPYGFGRIDAIGFILNQVMSTLPGMPENAKPSDAPASYPFLWGTDQSSVVQWTGFAANLDGAGDLIRNGGEVVGVYGKVALTKDLTYASSLNIENLGKIENWVRELNSPQWPTKVFGAVDSDKASAGEALYAKLCSQCHQVIPRDKAIKTAYIANLTPIADIGTDPGELDNLSRTYNAGIFEGKKTESLAGDKIPNPTSGLNPLINTVSGSLLHHGGESVKALLNEHSTITKSGPSVSGYKGRPLNGVWATAPFLHNGSVPNLYEILLPAEKRSKTFVLGSRLYDPVRVGFSMSQPTTAETYTPFTFDVSLKGNSNAGHEYGTKTADGAPALTDEERWQVVEYMKTL